MKMSQSFLAFLIHSVRSVVGIGRVAVLGMFVSGCMPMTLCHRHIRAGLLHRDSLIRLLNAQHPRHRRSRSFPQTNSC
ncbi:uncharacterized protein C8Q71DRAFT_745025 [Rhodofomes roseus]|uniref:Secreted protein n=1 Tax=Rhodofomes roseus TaxID=34475 RepID=A0ABQ8KNP7_9APHY|nr:uncharacterized protein C8Q71DRAFT_745025 [Rhodofomes roseus]KAH9839951.1 hypothetical protein C8Q71DRAFT_745025 [Rhodofomes roseus]